MTVFTISGFSGTFDVLKCPLKFKFMMKPVKAYQSSVDDYEEGQKEAINLLRTLSKDVEATFKLKSTTYDICRYEETSGKIFKSEELF